MRVYASLFLVSAMLVSARAQDVVLPDWADARKREAVEWPDALRGLVQDEAKTPIANAKVTVLVQVQLFPPGGGIVEKDVYRKEVSTDESGKWSLPTGDLPRVVHRPFMIEVKASAPDLVPWRTWTWYDMRSKKAYAKQAPLTLPQGYRLAGVCVDQDGTAASGVRFRDATMAAAMGLSRSTVTRTSHANRATLPRSWEICPPPILMRCTHPTSVRILA